MRAVRVDMRMRVLAELDAEPDEIRHLLPYDLGGRTPCGTDVSGREKILLYDVMKQGLPFCVGCLEWDRDRRKPATRAGT